jgi:rhodanese-related sulfurtransferase
MNIRKWMACIFSPLIMAGCQSEPVTLPERYTLLDVRTPDEYAAGHLQGAVLVPHTTIREKIGAAVPDQQTQILLYCRSGRRSAIAYQTLVELGYAKVLDLGSMDAAAKKTKLSEVR